MPYSKTIACNMGLSIVGVVARIQDVDNEISNEAAICRLWFDHLVELLHETCPWPFATRQIPLADVGSPPDDYAYRYKYPVDCKLAIKIVNPASRTPGTDQGIPFVIRDLQDGYGKCILTDQADAVLEYNTLVTDPAKWNSSFMQALSMGIGAHVGMPLRVDANIVKYAQGQFTNWLAEAINFKQREQKDDPEPRSEFHTVRG